MPNCTECSDGTFPCLKSLHLHYKSRHNEKWDLNTNFVFRCAEKNCYRDYTGWKTFRWHLLKFHKFPATLSENDVSCDSAKKPRLLEKQNNVCFDNINSDNVIDAESIQDSNNDRPDDKNVGEKRISDIKLQSIKEDLDSSILSFCSKLYANPNLPRNHVKHVFNDNFQFMLNLFKHISDIVELSNDTKPVKDSNLGEFFQFAESSFQSLDSEYKRFNCFREMGFIDPVSIEIGTREEIKIINGKVVKVRDPVYLQYIPLEKTLRSFFNLPGTLDAVLQYLKKLNNETEVLSDFVQGKLWKHKIKTHFPGKIVIPLFIYFDDFEINNPLGSHSIIQKLGAVYILIACIPPEFRSELQNIFLSMLFHAADRAELKNVNIFHELVKELNHLQDHGMVFIVDGKPQTIYFSVGLILGDNLGLNSVLELTEGFMSTFFCKLCKTPLVQTQSDTTERKENMRKVSDYDEDVRLGKRGSGVNGESVWNNVKYFHVYLNIYADKLHDLNEGLLEYGMGHLVYHYVFETPDLPLNILNDRLSTFNFYFNAMTNKPPPFTLDELKNKKLRLSGSETMNFTLIFSFLVGDLVDTTDEYWAFYLTMRQIIDIVLARNIQSDSAVILDDVVSQHLELYLKLFKNDPLKRKHHNLTHYGTILKMSGPLINLSTIRFEAKHKFFSDCAKSTVSRKNVTYTLAMKEQLRVLPRAIRGIGFSPKFESGPSTAVNKDNYILKLYPRLSSELIGNLNMSSSVEFNGITYRVNMYIVIGYDEIKALPVFGNIEHIFYDDENHIYFGYKVLYTEYFEDKLHAYKVKDSVKSGVIGIDDLYSPFTVIKHTMPDGKPYIMIKYAL